MPPPQFPLPRKFWRVAYQRLEEAEVLFDAGYYIGTVYLAGYAVECAFKALILNATPKNQHQTVEGEFRGQRAHSFEWLRLRYSQTGAAQIPPNVNNSLVFVNSWETSIRYEPGKGEPDNAKRFLKEVNVFIEWANNRV
jgi:hypothetical protein